MQMELPAMTDRDEVERLVERLKKLGRDMDRHAAPDWDEHEDVFAAADTIEALRQRAEAAEEAESTYRRIADDAADLMCRMDQQRLEARAQAAAAWEAAIAKMTLYHESKRDALKAEADIHRGRDDDAACEALAEAISHGDAIQHLRALTPPADLQAVRDAEWNAAIEAMVAKTTDMLTAMPKAPVDGDDWITGFRQGGCAAVGDVRQAIRSLRRDATPPSP
ncbi:hypothetical protein [Paracoccus sp. SM22M-07]|uniref:hypothetical protein n=1 Tax=Paracoccus sp. SM22M-07 TaxID=1520813 RepID=UPI0009159843|nr:hypothetical protein [Paracoccus sp. SM22M-07]OJH45154.1 hypothetical protein IE00_05660 [Paracoccus sp. SM22M-07]